MPLSAEQTSKLERQLAYYFSDSNIMIDKFLLGKVRESEEGWVEISVLCTFNKVKSITTDIEQIAVVAKTVKDLEVSEDNSKIRRITPLPLTWDPLPKTIYIKGETISSASHEELTEALSAYGQVARVSKRYIGKASGGQAKDSAYVEFVTEDDAKKVLALESLTFKDKPLEKMLRSEHDAKYEKPSDAKKRSRDEASEGDAEPPSKKAKEEPVVLPKDSSLKFTKVGDADWKDVKEAVVSVTQVRYCVIENENATLMVGSPEEAEKVVNKHKETPFIFSGVTPASVEILKGEEEEKFRAEMETKVTELRQRTNRPSGGKGKGKGKKGGRKGGKGGKRH